MDYEHNDDVLQTNITKELQGVADILNLNIQSHKKNTNSYGEKNASKIDRPYNRIIFGAPGTGKSYELKKDQENFFPDEDCFERITFHPAYSYAQFFGCYKPVGKGNDISYEYIPGPFLRVLLKALSNPENNYLLIIEEINRANVAAVFGDVFQLLDRKNGKSEYPVDISNEVKDYIVKYQNDNKKINLTMGDKLYLPSNFYIWATMNSADQGVMPLDTAFKRRWTFSYRPIDADEDKVHDFKTELYLTTGEQQILEWNKTRHIINNLLRKAHVNEDKWLGPFFLATDILQDPDLLRQMFASKVLMYLFEDAAKYDMRTVFGQEYHAYSDLLKDYQENGLAIFASEGD